MGTSGVHARRFGHCNEILVLIQRRNKSLGEGLGFHESEHYKQFTQECAKWLGWNCDILSGDPRLVMEFMNGNWDSDNFLIVEPGEMIVATHDDSIIGKQKAE